jgi:hypothetical protein
VAVDLKNFENALLEFIKGNKHLLEEGPEQDTDVSRDFRTRLVIAAQNGRIDEIQKLIANAPAIQHIKNLIIDVDMEAMVVRATIPRRGLTVGRRGRKIEEYEITFTGNEEKIFSKFVDAMNYALGMEQLNGDKLCEIIKEQHNITVQSLNPLREKRLVKIYKNKCTTLILHNKTTGKTIEL